MSATSTSGIDNSVLRPLIEGAGEFARNLPIERILTDTQVLRWFLDATHNRIQAFDDAVSVFEHIPFEGSVIFLIDNDVLRSYIETESALRGKTGQAID